MTRLSPFADHQDERGRGARSSHAVPDTRARSPKTPLFLSIAIAVLSIGGAAFVLARHAPDGTLRVALAAVAGAVALMLVLVAVTFATREPGLRQVFGQVSAARALAQRSQTEVRQLTERVLRGERPALPVPDPPSADNNDPFQLLARDLQQTRYVAEQAILQVASGAQGGQPERHVEIFVNLARRMQALVHREIELLDELEARVEDPDLLKGLFTVDHLATRMRRQSESLAVLGGSPSRRQWTRQVTMHEVLRASIAEVEQYSRVKVVPPVDGMLRGDAVSDVIHLVAELVENATKFSAPRTQVLLRAQRVAAGLAIEVEDRGLGMLPADQQRMNAVLADPSLIDIDDLLRDGRIGLFVVSTLSRRHGIRVQVQSNIYGGTQAILVLPQALVEVGEGEEEPQPARELIMAGDTAVPRDSLESVPLPPPVTPPYAAAEDRPAAPSEAEGSRSWDRPPLPKRQVQTNLAPELRADRDEADRSRYTQPPADQITGLMADFLRGVSRSDDEDPAAEN
jgi:signal transduction histidine kinase